MTLHQYLTKAGLSDYAFAQQIGVTQPYVWKLRKGLLKPSLQLAVAIVEASGGAIEYRDLLPPNLRPRVKRGQAIKIPQA